MLERAVQQNAYHRSESRSIVLFHLFRTNCETQIQSILLRITRFECLANIRQPCPISLRAFTSTLSLHYPYLLIFSLIFLHYFIPPFLLLFYFVTSYTSIYSFLPSSFIYFSFPILFHLSHSFSLHFHSQAAFRLQRPARCDACHTQKGSYVCDINHNSCSRMNHVKRGLCVVYAVLSIHSALLCRLNKSRMTQTLNGELTIQMLFSYSKACYSFFILEQLCEKSILNFSTWLLIYSVVYIHLSSFLLSSSCHLPYKYLARSQYELLNR